MIEGLLLLTIGALCAALLWRSMRGVFAAYVFQRQNYRGHALATAAGIVVVLVVTLVVGLHTLLAPGWRSWFPGGADGWDALSFFGPAMAQLCLAFGLLGLLDDLGGVGESGGFGGHLSALGRGRLTTGMTKMLFAPLATLVVIDGLRVGGDRLGLLRDVALVCLAANLLNLFDRAPGRSTKTAVLLLIGLVAAVRSARLAPTALVVGAGLGMMGPELREECMLGDAGSNVVGAAVGFGAVITMTSGWRWVTVAVLLALNLASEVVSFGKVIDTFGPLRWLDRLGSPHRR